MAPTVAAVGTLIVGADAATTTETVSMPSGVATGDLLVCPWSVEHSTSGTLLSPPSGWLAAPGSDSAFQAVSNGTACYVWYRVVTNAGSEPSTYAMPVQSGRWRRGGIIRITGADTSSPFESGQGAVSASSSSTPTVSVTAGGANRLALWLGGSYNTSAWSSVPTGFTELSAWADASTTTSTVAQAAPADGATVGEAVATGATLGKAAWVGLIKPLSSGATTATFGKTTDGAGSTSSAVDRKKVSSAVPSSSGTATSISVRGAMATTTCVIKGVIYADSSGAPGALLAVSDEITVNSTTVQEWVGNFSGANRINIVSGTTYWIGWIQQAPGFAIRRDSTASTALTNTDTYSDGPTDPFGAGPTGESGPVAVYVTYNLPSTAPGRRLLLLG